MKQLPLTKGCVALVDDEDYERVIRRHWHTQVIVRKNRSSVSLAAVSSIWLNGENAKILMHRFIMEPPDNMVVDHINHDRLDNRRANLRICTPSQNRANSRRPVNRGSGGLIGVYPIYWNKNLRWRARIANRHIGVFATKMEAAYAYDVAARDQFGEFAVTNFPIDGDVGCQNASVLLK